MDLVNVVAVDAAAPVHRATGGQGAAACDLGLPRSHLAFARCSSAGLMLGNFARLQEALHASGLLDGLRENGLVARRVRSPAPIVVVVDDNRIVVHNALVGVVQTGQVVVEAIVQGSRRGTKTRAIVIVARREQRHFRVHAAHLVALVVEVRGAQAALLRRVRSRGLRIDTVPHGSRSTDTPLAAYRLVGRTAFVFDNEDGRPIVDDGGRLGARRVTVVTDRRPNGTRAGVETVPGTETVQLCEFVGTQGSLEDSRGGGKKFRSFHALRAGGTFQDSVSLCRGSCGRCCFGGALLPVLRGLCAVANRRATRRRGPRPGLDFNNLDWTRGSVHFGRVNTENQLFRLLRFVVTLLLRLGHRVCL